MFEAVLFEPVPLAEALAGYCNGLLCRVARPTVVTVSPGQTDFRQAHNITENVRRLQGSYFFGIAALGIAIIACILTRHQAMMPDAHRLKLSKVRTCFY